MVHDYDGYVYSNIYIWQCTCTSSLLCILQQSAKDNAMGDRADVSLTSSSNTKKCCWFTKTLF